MTDETFGDQPPSEISAPQ